MQGGNPGFVGSGFSDPEGVYNNPIPAQMLVGETAGKVGASSKPTQTPITICSCATSPVIGMDNTILLKKKEEVEALIE